MVAKFTEHDHVLTLIKNAQEAEQEQRDLVHEQKAFLLLKDGQWDEKTTAVLDGLKRYRGTFDQVSPVIDQIYGEIESSDFAIKVNPSGGESTEPTAEIFAGIIRNIENMSKADQIYGAVAKSMVMAGLDGFEIVQEFMDADTFDQDILFKPVTDWYRSVWFDQDASRQDKTDSNWAIKLRTMSRDQYDEEFPKGAGVSVGDNHFARGRTEGVRGHAAVTVGKFYYKKPITITLIKVTGGAVYTEEDYEKAKEALTAEGKEIIDTRKRKSWRVWSRLMDGADWLKKAEKTVFDKIPLVPAYGNYEVFDKQDIYFGKTYRLMDPQRGLNFAMSSETEDVALSPPQFIMMTKEQGQGEDYSTMNIDRKAVRYFNHVDGQMPPMQMGGRMGNPGTQTTIANFQGLLQSTANMDDPSMGRNPGLQSGVAIDRLVSQSNNGNIMWFKAMEICLCAAATICLPAIPRVYGGTAMQKIIGEDGSIKNVEINKPVDVDGQGQPIYVNDLTAGNYDAVCSMGEAFKNQQEAATKNMIELITIDPTAIELTRDIVYKNQNWPGSDVIAKRARRLAIDSGLVQPEEYTEDDQKYVQQKQEEAAQQEQQEDPLMVAARAEEIKGQAEMLNAQNKQSEIQGNQQLKAAQIQLESEKLQLERDKFTIASQDKSNVEFAKIQQGQEQIDQGQQKIDLDADDQAFNQDLATKTLHLKAHDQSHSQAAAKQAAENPKDLDGTRPTRD